MKDCYLKARAYVDWLEFKEIVEDTFCSIEHLCKTYKGHNLDKTKGMFDCNYKSICCTVILTKDGFFTLTKDIEVWDDARSSLLGLYPVDELKHYIKEED